jgi:RNA polymerase sigma-70 factor (ECF subfamily)
VLLFPLLFAAIQSPAEERELAERLKRRDPHAIGDLYDRYGRLTYALILRIVKDTGVAEDLVQETFLRVWNRVQAFDHERGALGPWVMAVARNRAIDYIRSVEGRAAQSSYELDANEHPSLFANLESDILNSDRARRLRAAFQSLTPNQRLVIELAYYEGLSQSEMAARMKQPLGTIKTWTRAALRTLREQLTEAVAV